MTMQQLRSIVNDTAADAIDVSWNFGTIENQINTSLIDRNGTVAMTGQLTLLGAPTQALHAAPKEYVDAIQPVGMIVDYGGTAAPSGWLLCEGAIVDQSSYPALFAVVGTAFNTGGEGGTQFRLPDFRSRSAVHPSAVQVRGSTGGSTDVKEHLHQVPLHNHSVPLHNHTLNDHTHGLAVHTHLTDINHDHAAFTTAGGGPHIHNGGYLTTATGSGSNADLLRPHDASFSFQDQINTTNGEHTHTIDVPALQQDDITTKSQSGGTVTNSQSGGTVTNSLSTPDTSDKPAFDVTDKEATNTVSAGAGTDNYHPYLAVYKIIKL